ncbi:MBL fold metallo-hydrolase [Candidatus Saccharibacteria bacterium]|nr:MBL fold metallo-hydrolase [Candidatus Saccharibacteria bacterium]
MEITKLEHSGIVITKAGKRIIFDPVEFEKTVPAFDNVVAVIITHKHSDHFQPAVLNRILGANPSAKVFTTSDTAPLINNAIVVKAGDTYNVDGFKLDFFGKDHAAIVPGQIPCENIGVVVDDSVVNPGDSFDLPANIEPQLLFVPTAAPWLKIVESMNYIEKAKPKMVIPIHDALLSELGETISNNWVKKACESEASEFVYLNPGESREI